MRILRALSVGLVLALAMSTAVFGGGSAYAQDVGDAERRANEAAGLVDEAVANRAEIELQLATTLSRINDLSAELSIVSAGLDRVAEQIGFADVELVTIQDDIEIQAVDAYMTALAMPAISFVNSDTVETAIVAGTVVEEVVTAGREQVDLLVIKKRDLQALQEEHLAKQEEVARLKAEVDAEMDELTRLYEEADAEVAAAIKEAQTADAEYRAALSAVEAAQAREAEKKRQESRGTTTTTTATNPGGGGTTPSTTSPPPTSPTTTSGGSGSGGWTGRPAVEQWRPLVQQHFPANRVDQALQIIQCESLGDPNAYNPYSGASGLFQFLPSTWATTAPKAGYAGASVFDPVANTATAAWLANRYQELGQSYWQPWSCRRVLN